MKYRVAGLLLFFFLAAGALTAQSTEVKAGSLSTRGVWVSCFEYDEIGLAGKSEAEFRQNANKLFYNIKANGCNTVYFHVRSYDDAIYPSKVTGWSKRMTKGTVPSYDPLKILISYAHKYGLEFHAWMNPYRVTQKKVLNPGDAKTTERIVSQVKEIINNYSVDGIHFDDYFYPTNEKKYNKVKKQERMKHVNTMVKKVYQAVKNKKKGLKFGISPAGNIEYCEKIGADVKTWMSVKGYVDYIVPQIYWSDQYILNGKKTALFKDTLAEWRSLNKRDIPMYIGLAAYKAGENIKEDPGWKKKSSNLSNQLKQIRNGNSEGYVLFEYTDLYRSNAWKEIKNVLASISTIQISRTKKTIRAGKKFKIKVISATPARIVKGIRFRTSNKKIATVTAKGTVKAKKKGTVKITAYYGTRKKVCKVKVLPKKATKKK